MIEIFKSFMIPGSLLFFGILIGFIFRIYMDIKMQRMYQNNIFKNIDISKCKIDTVITILNTFKGYSKIIKHGDFIFYITEYGMYEGVIFDVYGTVIGKENDEYWNLRDNQEDEKIINPLIKFNEFRNQVREKVGNSQIDKYIIMGGNCIFRVPLKSIKILRMNAFNYILNKMDMKPKYTKEQIDKIYNDLLYLNDKEEIIDK
jgi:hypothetical protein